MQSTNMTQEYAHSLFEYKDGCLYWRVQKAPHVKIGAKVGSPAHGYESVYVDGRNWRIHRLVFLMHFGYLPSTIDHINGIKDDNRIENLREATPSENGYNKILLTKSKSGIKNVQWISHMNKWQVRLKINKQNKVMGYFEDLELADLVATEARDKFHGKFANHGYKEQLA